MKLIPAIDIINGECVRLTKGDYARKKTYSTDPVEVALRYEDAGLRYLHVVDLDGAKASAPQNLAVLERIASRTSLQIQWGGGVKTAEALQAVFNSGAARAICGSVAVKNPELFLSWLRQFGPDRLILGADIRDGKVSIHGWTEDSQLGAAQLIEQFLPAGLSRVICTDISRDGMLEGPSFQLYNDLQRQFPTVEIIASGGVSSVDDLLKLKELGVRATIIGKALYEGRITLADLSALEENNKTK